MVTQRSVRRQSENEDYSGSPGGWGACGRICCNAARCAARLDDIEIKEKYLGLTSGLMDDKRSRLILDEVMSTKKTGNLAHLLDELRKNVECVLK